MEQAFHISETAQRLGVTPTYLSALEAQGHIPTARRDSNGRIYTEFDIALLKSIGIGFPTPRLKQPEEVVGDSS